MEVHAVKTWFDQKHGVVELDGDVLNIVEQVKVIGDGRLHIFYNPQTDGFDVVESCLDGTDRLVFSADALDQRILDRLHKADHWGSENPERPKLTDENDFLSDIERHNQELEDEKDEAGRDKLGDAGERLAWALDLVNDRPSVGGSISVPKDLDG